MRMFRIDSDVNVYQCFLTENDEDVEALWMDGRPRAASWVPPRVFVFSPRNKVGDFFQFGGAGLIASPRATVALRAFFDAAGELLPLPFGGVEYSLLNVLHIVDCLDLPCEAYLARSQARYRLSAEGVHRLAHTRSVLFKTPETVRSEVLLVEGLLPADLEFRAVVKREDLNGLLFHEVWSDEDE